MKWDIHQITEYRDGAIYNTKLVGEVWLPLDQLPVDTADIKHYATAAELKYKEV